MKYKIQKGDNLTKISKKFGVSIKEIQKVNNIKNIDLVHVDDTLEIPLKEKDENR